MKPLKLILSGWGPYKDTQSVDFTSLQSGGLFLITGATGAGKTTIFDGISFALYGEVSGSIREKDSLRSDFATADIVTKVEFIFFHKSKEYRIVRNPSYSRAKLRGEGVTTEHEAGELYEGKTVLAIGSQQVTLAVTELLGMDYRQFKQISMIAQGEFHQLLMASSKERTLIFRDIFQTKLYDTITWSLGQKVKHLNEGLEEGKHRMEEVVATFRMEGEEWFLLCGKKNRNYEAIVDFIRIDLEQKKQEKDGLVEAQTELEREYKGLVQRLEQVRQNNRIIHQYEMDYHRLNQLEQELKEEKEKSTFWKKEEKKIPILEKGVETLQANIRLLEEQWNQGKGWIRERQTLQQLQQQYLDLDEMAKKKKGEYERLEDMSKKAAAGILAQTLEQGTPCPVCGSTTHPILAQMEQKIPSEQQRKELKQEAERQIERAAQAHSQAATALGVLLQMEKQLGAWKLSLESDGDTVLKQIRETMDFQQKEVDAQKEELNRIKQGSEGNRLIVERKKATYHQAKEGLHKPKNMEKQELSDLSTQIQELEVRRKRLIRERERVQTIWSVNHSGLKQLNEHREARQILEREYGVLRGLERAASGSNPRKLVLEQYVLSVYFDHILQAANVRLMAMSGERYELYRLEEHRDRRMKEGMEIEVLDQYTGKRRSVKSLSGGETFKAALALALGTSDVVQGYAGGILVETLFVDEGFGSLDSESLGQAVGILSKLSGGQRMIGIISHVEELKEQIDAQILVEKNNNGSSIRTNFLVYS